jgi:hypothetical protein
LNSDLNEHTIYETGTRLICSYQPLCLEELPTLAEYYDNLVAGRFVVRSRELRTIAVFAETRRYRLPQLGEETRVDSVLSHSALYDLIDEVQEFECGPHRRGNMKC